MNPPNTKVHILGLEMTFKPHNCHHVPVDQVVDQINTGDDAADATIGHPEDSCSTQMH